jgi:hypothetical protein
MSSKPSLGHEDPGFLIEELLVAEPGESSMCTQPHPPSCCVSSQDVDEGAADEPGELDDLGEART